MELCNGQRVEVKLWNLRETRDPIRQAVHSAKVTVMVDGEEKGRAVQFGETFQLSEYGRQPTPKELRTKFFPFFGAE